MNHMRSSPQGLRLPTFGLLVAVCLLGAALGGANARAQWSLIPSGAQWSYLADGTQPDPAWVTEEFNEFGWSFGQAKLGFGNDGEVTGIGNAANQYITFYFRHRFSVPSTSGVVRLVGRMVVDDGAVIYLNTNEVFRFNLPPGPLNSLTLASNTLNRPLETNYFTAIFNGQWLREGQNVIAVEVHQATPGSSDLGFDLELQALSDLTPPTVVEIFTPPLGEAYGVGSNVTVAASVTDPDSPIAGVDFRVDGVPWFTDTAWPYTFLLGNLTSGRHEITAVARDVDGLSNTSAPVAINGIPEFNVATVVPNGAFWRYLDNGSDQGTNWHLPGFVDLSWPVGLAEFGYGDTTDDPPRPERTQINGGPATNRFVTTYFRRTFNVPNPFSSSNLLLRLLRDDGAVVWLNGVEVFRSNLNPTNPIPFNALALGAAGDDGATYVSTNINPAFLHPGQNLLAVEIHQNSATSSDISFDLMLLGQPAQAGWPFFVNRPEHQNARIGQPAVFQAVVIGEEPLSFTWSHQGMSIPGADGPTLVIPNVQVSDLGQYSVTVNNRFGGVQAFAELCAPPVIFLQPSNIVSTYGATVSFQVQALLAGSYLWFFNGVPIPNVFGPTLTITNVNRDHVGIYFARAFNGSCSADSRSGELQVCITRQGAPMAGRIAVPEDSGFVPASGGGTLPMHHGIPLLFSTDNATQSLAIRCGVSTAYPKVAFFKPLLSTPPLRFSTEGSDFDTVLEVEDIVNNYVPLGCDDDSGERRTSVLTLSNLVVGRHLQVRVSGKVGSTLPAHGIVRLQIGSMFHGVFRAADGLHFTIAVPGRTNYSLRATNRFNPMCLPGPAGCIWSDPSVTWPVFWSTNAVSVPEVLQRFTVPLGPATNRFFGLRRGL